MEAEVSLYRKGSLFDETYTGDAAQGRERTAAGAVPPPRGKSYAPDKLVDVLHIRLDLSFDLDARAVSGQATHTMRPLADGLDKVVMDCVELTVDGVRDAQGRALSFDHDGEKLTIFFGGPKSREETFDIAVSYHGKPRLGLYFTGPTKACPDKAIQVWSQGQDEDSRYWFPCFDYPNEKATSETLVTVPETWTVVGNGRLLKVAHNRKDRTKTWHHKESTAHVSYLISIACGEFAVVGDTWRDIPVQYFVKPGFEAHARRAFSQTPDMLTFFSDYFGYDYPYEKYSQVVVEDFIFGGMENISATTLIDRCLPDERAARDYEPQDLVSHELAHQWFGDLLTCKDWSHAWLNEGFASYSEVLYREHWRGEDDAGYHRLLQAKGYFARDRVERRPIVTKGYTIPMELFDAHIYQKGSLVLHMLRNTLGEKAFRRCLSEYLRRFAGRTVQTEDLIGVIAEITGRNLEWFFDQWIFGAGYPELDVTFSWDDDKKTAVLTVDQKHKIEGSTGLFRMPVAVRFHGRKGVQDETVQVAAAHQVFAFRFDEKPLFVNIDPGSNVLKKLKLTVPPEMLKAQLKKDPDWFGRVEAARALCRNGNPSALAAVAEALRKDPFWGARAEMAEALGANGSLLSRDILIGALRTRNDKVRRSVVRALAGFQDDETADALIPLAKKDPSYFVEGEANASLGATRRPQAFAVLSESAGRESHLDVVRVGALSGMAGLKDERAWPVLKTCAGPGGPPQGRMAALRAMALMAKGREPYRYDIREIIEGYLHDSDFFVKFGAILALETLQEPAAAEAVERTGFREADGRIRMNCRDIAKKLRTGDAGEEAVEALKTDVEKLREESRLLADRVTKMEARLGKSRKKVKAGHSPAKKGVS
jgi:aminopeptidase N